MSKPATGAEKETRTEPGKKLLELTAIMERLRGKEGCPWDREQDFSTLVPFLIEETYEVVAAIDSGSHGDLKEELGDLLFQIIFLSELAREAGSFDISGVIESSIEKMVRRHPHVFEDAKADTAEDVVRNWALIKEEEKRGTKDENGLLSDVPHTFPALMRAHKLAKKAAGTGFDWEDIEGAFDKLSEEIDELKEAIKGDDRLAIEEELGDLIFSVVNIARFVEVDPEEALRKTIGKFINRFHYIEKTLAKKGVSLGEATIDEMEKLWQEAKEKKETPGKPQP